MAYTLKDAKPLCTKPEFELVTMAHKADLVALGPARLRQKITRVRKLRDKFRDESARQRREARGKADPRGTRAAQGNERTVKKAEIFADVLTRFEAAFEASRTKAPAKKVTKKTTKKAAKKVSKKTSKKTAKKATTKKAAKKTAKKTAPKTTKKAAKKTSKKAAKKASKKVSKKAAKKPVRATSAPSAKALIRKAGTKASVKASRTTPTSPAASLTDLAPPHAPTLPLPTDPVGVTGTSTPRSAIRAGFRSAGEGRAKGHVVSRTRAAQGRRDAK